MKITFFKNENDFSECTTYCWENAELAKPKIQNNLMRIFIILLGLIALPIYVIAFKNEFSA